MAKAKNTTRDKCRKDGTHMNYVDCSGCKHIIKCLEDESIPKDLGSGHKELLLQSIPG